MTEDLIERRLRREAKRGQSRGRRVPMKKQASPAIETDQGERSVAGLLPAPPSDSPSTVLALIERVALDPRADVEKLERMMAMYNV